MPCHFRRTFGATLSGGNRSWGTGGTFNEPHATLRIQWVWETRAGVALKSVPILMAASASWLLSEESTEWIHMVVR